MSRSGYSDDCDGYELTMYRTQVANATRGKRGQRMLTELRDALDAMPSRRLIQGVFVEEGDACALGVLGQARGLDMSGLGDDCSEAAEHVGNAFDIARQLAAEVMYENDEVGHWKQTPEERWTRMRAWVGKQIREAAQ